MNIEQNLKEIGLTHNQAKIYLSLLKLKKATVKEISKDCGYTRTNIYDIIEELKERGLVTFFKEGKSTRYLAVDPKNLSLLLDEKRAVLSDTLPMLEQLFAHPPEGMNVQVYKGMQGMKIAFNNILKMKGKVYYGLNIRGQLREQLPVFATQFYRRWKERSIHYKAIYTVPYTAEGYDAEIRYIHSKYATPVATHIYDDIVLIQVWQPSMVAIEIQSSQIAEAYKNHFKIMWKDASKKPLV